MSASEDRSTSVHDQGPAPDEERWEDDSDDESFVSATDMADELDSQTGHGRSHRVSQQRATRRSARISLPPPSAFRESRADVAETSGQTTARVTLGAKPDSPAPEHVVAASGSNARKSMESSRALRARPRSGESHTLVDNSIHAPPSRRSSLTSMRSINIPLRAYVVPRPGSVYMEPAAPAPTPPRPSSAMQNKEDAKQRGASQDRRRSQAIDLRQRKSIPLHQWLFLAGFLLPLIWWIASFVRPRIVQRSNTTGTETWEEYDYHGHVWQFRCRLIGSFSFVLCITVAILLIVFRHRI